MVKPRIGTLMLLIALIVSVLAAVSFFLDRNNERQGRLLAEGQLRQLTAAKEMLERERDDLTKAKEVLEVQLTDTKAQATSLAEEAKKLSDQIAQEKRAGEAMKAEVARVKANLESERREKLTLTEELAKAKQSYQALSNELTTLRQAKAALEKRVKEMLAKQAAEAEKIVVRPEGLAGAVGATPIPAGPRTDVRQALEGKILIVNREFNFVVVDLGSKNGLTSASQLSILRADKLIGRAQVEKLYDNMAAATLITEDQKGQVREGDLVRVTS